MHLLHGHYRSFNIDHSSSSTITNVISPFPNTPPASMFELLPPTQNDQITAISDKINDVMNRHTNRVKNAVQKIVDENEAILHKHLEQQQHEHSIQVNTLKDEITRLDAKCDKLTQYTNNSY
eukprot:UN06456